MQELYGTIANDLINKYNEKLTIGAMVGSYQAQWQDLLPMAVNHDHRRFIGWTQLSGIFLEPGTTHLTNVSFLPETEEDRSWQEKIYNRIFNKMHLENKEAYDQLLDSLIVYLSGNQRPCYVDSVSVIDHEIVSRVFPELWAKRDKDGLISLSELPSIMPGIFLYKGFLIFAHPYFRRSMSRLNSLNTPFLKRLLEYVPNAKIAIDPDMIGLLGSQSTSREYAYWWGPKFDDDLSKIPFGVTHHENEYYNALMSPIIRTECGWYIQDNIRTFECEEVTDVKNLDDSVDLYGCRYVHSMLSASNIPCHLDGAVRGYDDEKMLVRLERSLDQAARNTTYTKLWRIDGEIPIHLWKELITHYYRDNTLIGEYFGAEKEKTAAVENSYSPEGYEGKMKGQSVNNQVSQYLPHSLSMGDGLRVQISIESIETMSSEHDVFIRPLNYHYNHKKIRAIEYESITLAKALSKAGLNVRVPSCKYLAFGDLDINFPVFTCRTAEQGSVVIDSIIDFCKVWANNGDSRIISFTIKINYPEYAVNYSMIGHVNDFVQTLSNPNVYALPDKTDGLVSWCEALRFELDKFPPANQQPSIGALNYQHRLLHYNRREVPLERIQEVKTSEGSIYAQLLLTPEEITILKSNNITASSAYTINNSTCSVCGKQYERCACIKFMAPNCINKIDSAEYFGAFWTNRSVYDGMDSCT